MQDVVAIWPNVPPMAALFPIGAALGIYLFLRLLIWGANGTSLTGVSRHALWVGIIGWLTSNLIPAANAGILPPPGQPSPLADPGSIAAVLAWPVAGAIMVHALGQMTYPGPRLSRRSASLSVRRIRDFLPHRLAWTATAIYGAAIVQVAWTATLPGFPPGPAGPQNGSAAGWTGGAEGRIPGIELAACLGGALIVLAGGTLAVLALITRRRPLEFLEEHHNALLRTIAMNRLLRTAAIIAAGLAAIAANHAVRQEPADLKTGWTNHGALFSIIVLLVMWVWSPPKLAADQPGGAPSGALAAVAPHPAIRFVTSIGAASGAAAVLAATMSAVIPGVITEHPAMAVAVPAAAILAMTGAGEFVIHRNHGAPAASRNWPRQPASRALLIAAATALIVLLAAVTATATAQFKLGVVPSWHAAVWTGAPVTALALLTLAAARARHGLATAGSGLDGALRAITVFRVVRTLAAYFAVQAGVLLLSAGPSIRRGLELEPAPWAGFWHAAPLTGAVLFAAGIVGAVMPVRSLAPASGARNPAKEPAA